MKGFIELQLGIEGDLEEQLHVFINLSNITHVDYDYIHLTSGDKIELGMSSYVEVINIIKNTKEG